MMIENSLIEWTGPTWNWLQGCVKKTIKIEGQVKLREECRNCYMYRDKKRYGKRPEIVVRSAPATFNKPLKLQAEVEAGLRPNFQDRLVFACSWSDWNNPEGDAWRPEAWDIVRRCKDLIFQILTKLPERMNDHLPPFWDEIKDRCWVGVSCGYQEAADQMIPALLEIPAPIRFLSCEPLLGPLNIREFLYESGIPVPWQSFGKSHWVIGGGESGPNARPCHPEWARGLRNQCQEARVPFFWKQWGEYTPYLGAGPFGVIGKDGKWAAPHPKDVPSYQPMQKVGKKKAGNILDGQTWQEFPQPANR